MAKKSKIVSDLINAPYYSQGYLKGRKDVIDEIESMFFINDEHTKYTITLDDWAKIKERL